MNQVLITKAAARAIVGTEWFKSQTITIGTALSHIKHATSAGYQTKVWMESTRVTQLYLDILNPALKEMTDSGVKTAAIQPVLDLKNRLAREHELLVRSEAEQAEKQKKLDAERAAGQRAYNTKRRERNTAIEIEVGRSKELKEICEDYGLNYQSPQIRAALVAAFHAGVQHLRDAQVEMVYGRAHDTRYENEKEYMEALIERDKRVFERAREAAAAARVDEPAEVEA